MTPAAVRTAQLPVDQRGEVVADKGQDRVRHWLQLARHVVVVVDGRGARLQWLRAGDGDQIADPAAVLILPRTTKTVIALVGGRAARTCGGTLRW